MKRLLCHVAFIPICIALFTGCGTNPDSGNPGTIGKRPAISGKLLQSDGISAAPGALVTLRPRNAVAPIGGSAKVKVQQLLAQTASDGSFAIDSCPAGVYSIEGTGTDGKSVRIDSITVIDPHTTTDIPATSLQSTGTVKGNVVLANGGDPGNVFVLAFGSDRFVQVSTMGSFLLDNLPYGNYALKIVCILPECGMSQTISVKVAPGATAVLDTITLAAQVADIPENVSLQYDSMKLAVTLHWKPCVSPGIKGYNVYRYNKQEANQYSLQPFNPNIIGNECSYVDSALFTDQSYVYGIAAVATDNSIGRKAGPLEVTTTFGGYHIDTLFSGTSDEPYRNFWYTKQNDVFWDAENRLIVATRTHVSGEVVLTVKFYTADLKFDYEIKIMPHVDIKNPTLKLSSDRIYFYVNVNPDSSSPDIYSDSLQCYALNGDFLFAINLQKEVQRSTLRNNSLFIKTDFLDYSDSIIPYQTSEAAAFDTTGKQLFIIDNRIHHATNGKLYSMEDCYASYNHFNNNIIIKEHILTPMNSIELFYTYDENGCGSLSFKNMDANGGFFLLYTVFRMKVLTEKGELYARFSQSAAYITSMAIDSKGRIAYLHRRDNQEMIVVITPP